MKVWHDRFIALLFGVGFAYLLPWLAGFSAGMMPALGVREWTREHVKFSMFAANLYAYVLTIVIISLLIGFTLARVFGVKDRVSAVLASAPPIAFLMMSAANFSWFSWNFELPKVLAIVFCIFVAQMRVKG